MEGGRALVGSRPEGTGGEIRSEECTHIPLPNAEEENDLHGPSFLRLLKKARALHHRNNHKPDTGRYARHP